MPELLRRHLGAAGLAAALVSTLVVVWACAVRPMPPSTEPAATSAPAACGKDTDCKGERVCDKGQCVSPP